MVSYFMRLVGTVHNNLSIGRARYHGHDGLGALELERNHLDHLTENLSFLPIILEGRISCTTLLLAMMRVSFDRMGLFSETKRLFLAHRAHLDEVEMAQQEIATFSVLQPLRRWP